MRRTSGRTMLFMLLAARAAPRLCADLVLPVAWDVGTIGDTATVSRTITLQNTIRNPLAAGKRELNALPVLVIGSTVLQGEKEIRARFEKEMRASATR